MLGRATWQSTKEQKRERESKRNQRDRETGVTCDRVLQHPPAFVMVNDEKRK
jgi:hypothetical protein